MSAFHLLLDHLFSSWKLAFLSLFVVDVPLERFVAFCIQCRLQLRLCCEFPSFIPEWLGGTVFLLGHLILLTHLVHFLLCLSPVSRSECILAGLFSCLHVFQHIGVVMDWEDCPLRLPVLCSCDPKAASVGFCPPGLWTNWSSLSWTHGLVCCILLLPLRTSALPSHSCWSQIWFWLLNLDNPFLFVSCVTRSIFPGWLVQNLCQRGLAQEICWIAHVLPYHSPKGQGGKALGRTRAWYHEIPSTYLSSFCILD